MSEDTKLFWYAVITFLLSLILLFIGVLLYLYISLHREEPFGVIFQDFALNLAIWELIVAISGVFLLHRLFKVYVKHKFEMQSIFRILFEAVSHRFGNYLATQRVNVEIARKYKSRDALDRMNMSLLAMENDFRELVTVLKNLEEETLPKESVNIGRLVKNIISDIHATSPTSTNWKVKGNPGLTISCEFLFAKIMFSLLLDNASRHCRNKVYVKYGYGNQGQKYCVILNDTYPQKASGGIGLGLKLAYHFASKTNVKLKIKTTSSWFCCLLDWK